MKNPEEVTVTKSIVCLFKISVTNRQTGGNYLILYGGFKKWHKQINVLALDVSFDDFN